MALAPLLALACLLLLAGLTPCESQAANGFRTQAPAPSSNFTLRLLPSDTRGKCLDGSPGGYYYRIGSGAGAKSWRIHIRGGGWCTDLPSCLARSKTNIGTSTVWTKDIDQNGDDSPYGFMNSTEPHFGDWTTVFIEYCDGSSFTSSREDPIVVNGTSLYFRGKDTLTALFQDMDALNGLLTDADAVILTGTSAGGLATYVHMDYLRSILPQATTLHALPDAGFFLDHATMKGVYAYRAAMQQGLALWQGESGLNQACVAHYAATNETWRCYFAQYTHPFNTVPTYVVNSMYDIYSVESILQLGCNPATDCSSEQLAAFQAWRDTFEVTANATLKATDGIFGTACYQHEETCADIDWDHITIDDTILEEAFYQWFLSSSPHPSSRSYDVRWPGNKSCTPNAQHGGC